MFNQKFSAFPHTEHEHMKKMLLCYSICSSCAQMCTDEGMKQTAKLCNDCADICALAIKLHSRDSEFNPQIMQLCADVCKRCGEECAKMKAEHCQQCSKICHECSKECEKE